MAMKGCAFRLALSPVKFSNCAIKASPILNKNSRGDQLVTVNVQIPSQLTEEQKRLFESLGKTMGTEVKIQERSFLDKLKDMLGG